jgi:transcription elongation factor GreA-like protein
LYKKIIKIDFSEADLAKVLAKHYEDEGNEEEAIEYYKKALLRYINNENYSGTTEMWGKLITYIPDNIDFFQLARRKMAKSFGEPKTVSPMEDLYQYYKDSQQWDTAIEILKQNIEIEPTYQQLRKNLIECYRGKYSNHSQLESCIKSSNIEQGYRNIFEAITDFEKHIAFDKKGFVFHNNWGVGIITDIKKQNDTNLGEKLIINFGRQHGVHDISLKLAVNSIKCFTN